MNHITTLVAATLVATVLAPGAQAQALYHLTTANATIADGDRLCKKTNRYTYAGGDADDFKGAADDSYPSPALVAYLAPYTSTVHPYDKKQNNQHMGDSFNLQHQRSVCHAVIEFKARRTGDFPVNDLLTIGHSDGGGLGVFPVAQVTDPGSNTAMQSYALDATGLALLSLQTGINLDKSPQDAMLDLYLQDDTELDYFRLHVWYGPNCAQTQTCP